MQFYSYLWLREDGTPYYVGKGSGNRAFVRGSHHCSPPKDKSRILIFPMLNEAEAIESEIAIITLFGRKDLGIGCLRNFTDGGDGLSGFRHADKTRQHLREVNLGKVKHTQQHKDYLRAVFLSERNPAKSQEARKKIGLASTRTHTGQKRTSASRTKMQQASQKNWKTAEHRKNQSDGLRRWWRERKNAS